MDAVRSAREKASLFEGLKAERDQKYNEWLRCNQEGAIKERVSRAGGNNGRFQKDRR